MIKKFIGLSGLPRSGSTLLSSILSQNPDIHAEGNSALCQLMWDLQQSCRGPAHEQIVGNNRIHTEKDVISALPYQYYKNVNSSIVFDKCRSWTHPLNLEMLYRYFNNKPKVIVLERPLHEVVRSFASLRIKNNYHGDDIDSLLIPNSEPIMRSFECMQFAKKNNNGEFLFITYKDLVEDTKSTISKIYDFCEIDLFNHYFDDIVNIYPENDAVYELNGQHDIRPKIGYRDLEFKLSDEIIQRCNDLG
jgi:sulfotransferase